jgi:uncharacterized membrane protein
MRLLFLLNLIALDLLVAGEAKALDRDDLRSLQDAIHNLCVQPDKRGSYLKVSGNLDADATLSVSGVNADAIITREQWDGINQELKYHVDPRECAIKLTGILAPLLSGEEPAQLEPATIRICNNAYDFVYIAVVGYGVEAANWLERGWYKTKYRDCLTFRSFTGGMFYYYAEAGSITWSGKSGVCVNPGHRFDEIDFGGDCNQPYVIRQFRAQYIPNAGFTVNLTRPNS